MAISVSTPASTINGELNATSMTLSSYIVPAGSNKILVVTISTEEIDAITHDTVTHNGVSMTKRKDALQGGNRCTIWDLQLGSTTPTGDIVVTYSVEARGSAIGVVTLINAKQQVPEADNSATTTSSPINTAITTITDNALIIDGLSTGGSSTISITQGPDQVDEISIEGSGTGFTLGLSSRPTTAAGAYTLGWSQTAPNRMVHVLLAYEEVAAPATFKTYISPLGGLLISDGSGKTYISPLRGLAIMDAVAVTGFAPKLWRTSKLQGLVG